MKITWFRHHHEDRNDLLRFGFMRQHYRRQLHYVEKPFSDAKAAGFSRAILDYPDRRHLSFILVQDGKRQIKCLVDSEDSFALITPLIAEVDVCFCAGYNADFFERKQFVKPYSWQNASDIEWYKRTLEEKISTLGAHFGKIKKFVPMTTNMGFEIKHSLSQQKIRNVLYRINRMLRKENSFSDAYKGFEIRDEMIRNLRYHTLQYDVVLNDSLWGWPLHRISLHHQLGVLHTKGYRIHSVLNWVPPCEIDGGSKLSLDPKNFPLCTSPITDKYEVMLAKSRLAVFACGFHWGWRSIMMLALSIGIPVLTDRLLTEAYFDMKEFAMFEQEDHSWSSIERMLNDIDHAKWEEYKKQNQEVYDRYMTPEAVANYFINALN